MSSSSHEKGARAEREVVEIFDCGGFNQAQRSRSGAAQDRGDLAGVDNLTIEVKYYTDVTRALREGLAELVVEKENNKTRWGVLCIKRKYRGWYAVMPLDEFVDMYAQLVRPGGERRIAPPIARRREPRGAVKRQKENPGELFGAAKKLRDARLAREASDGGA